MWGIETRVTYRTRVASKADYMNSFEMDCLEMRRRKKHMRQPTRRMLNISLHFVFKCRHYQIVREPEVEWRSPLGNQAILQGEQVNWYHNVALSELGCSEKGEWDRKPMMWQMVSLEEGLWHAMLPGQKAQRASNRKMLKGFDGTPR